MKALIISIVLSILLCCVPFVYCAVVMWKDKGDYGAKQLDKHIRDIELMTDDDYLAMWMEGRK